MGFVQLLSLKAPGHRQLSTMSELDFIMAIPCRRNLHQQPQLRIPDLVPLSGVTNVSQLHMLDHCKQVICTTCVGVTQTADRRCLPKQAGLHASVSG